MQSAPVYLDHAATTPIDPEVIDAMMPFLTTEYGNPSAVYEPGRKARHVLEKCRARVAELLGAGSAEIVFTSGGSESNNTALMQASGSVISSRLEHESIRVPLQALERRMKVVYVSATETGMIQPNDVERAIEHHRIPNDGSGLASFMAVNNELGTINPIVELGNVLSNKGVRFHTDAVQAVGLYDLSAFTPAVDYMTLSGHKFGGPKGIGILYVKAGVPYRSFHAGGSQEQDRRAGTENVASIVGMTRALELAGERRESNFRHLQHLKEQLVGRLKESLPENIRINSPQDHTCSPHILNAVCLGSDGKGLDGEMLILGLDMEGIYVSAGSACSSGSMKPSSVLLALGLGEQVAKGAIRISMGHETTADDIERAATSLTQIVRRMTQAAIGQKALAP